MPPRWFIIMLRVAAALRPATRILRGTLACRRERDERTDAARRLLVKTNENLRRPAAQALSDRLASNALGFPHDSLDKPLKKERKNTPRNFRVEAQHPTKVFRESRGVL